MSLWILIGSRNNKKYISRKLHITISGSPLLFMSSVKRERENAINAYKALQRQLDDFQTMKSVIQYRA